jgi:signal transduction histidine kinase
VKWNREVNFHFWGDKTLMVHTLFNLFKNSLYYIHAAKKGIIEIWCEKKEDGNILHFKDTGKGILSDALPKLFEKFYTTTYHGTGLGLAFCKLAMTGFGGSIKCTSEYGEFTEFEMIFPNQVNLG